MATIPTAFRAAAVLGAAAALTVAGAGAAAAATTATTNVDGNTVSVTFEWESDGGLDITDTCGAAAVEPAAAADLASAFAGGDIQNVLRGLVSEPGVHVLYKDGLVLDTPFVVLGDLDRSGTVQAELETGTYAVVSVCSDDPTNPNIDPMVIVGDPIEAVLGSVESFSAGGDGLGTLSSVLGGDEGIGLDALSSVLDGEPGDGDGLGTLSSALVGGTGDTD